VTTSLISQLTVIAVAAVAAPLLAELSGKVEIPGVVLEIVLGVLIGPEVLNWTQPTGIILDFSNFGLALLMFLAGAELDLPRLRGGPLKLSLVSWGGSLALASLVGLTIFATGHKHGEFVTSMALATTALGTLLPIARDNGLLETPLGRHILAVGSIGEFGPIVLVALILSGQDPGVTIALLLSFAAIAAVTAIAAGRTYGQRITGVVRRGLHSSSQLPVRLSLLVIMTMVFLASHLGLDLLLGSFSAGVIVRIAVAGRDDVEQVEVFRGKIEAVGFGFLVPIFFIVSGMSLDLTTFGHHPRALLWIPLFVLLMLVIRGLPVMYVYRHDLPSRAQRRALALFAATGLPLIVVITTIGVADHRITTQIAASLVSAGMITVLFFPALAVRVARKAGVPAPAGSAPA
jgi:Kef-type K+ transport system membrane component KefB